MTKTVKKLLPIIIFIGPSFIGFLIFYVIPFIMTFYYSLLDSPITKKFVYFRNYLDLITNPIFLRAVKNTSIFIIISVPVLIILSFVLSIMLNKYIKSSFFRFCFIIPLVIPVATVTLFWQFAFDNDGIINKLLMLFSIDSINWMNSDLLRFVVIVVFIWKYTGYNIIIFTTGLKSIPKEYYEVALVEGASKLYTFFHVTCVYIIPTGFFVLIISLINSFKIFREAFLIGGRYPHESIYTLQHYMNNVIIKLDYQKLTTAAILFFTIIFIMVILFYKSERRICRDIT